MISAIEINGFQIHKYSLLEFSPGVNLIIGDNDQGKTAIMRALRWVYENKPLGTHFINEDIEKAEVTVELDEDKTVTRIRSKTDNKYVLNGDDEFQAMRASVPTEISSVLNISPVTVHRQHDPLYMLQQTSSGERAKAINEIIGLEIIDKSIKKVNSIISTAKKEKTFYREKLKSEAEKLASMVWLKEAEKIFAKIERRKIAWKITRDKYNRIQDLIYNHEVLDEKISIGEEFLRTKPSIDKAEKLIQTTTALKDSIASLSAQIKKHDLYHSKRTIAEQITKQEKAIKRTERLLDEVDELESEKKRLAKMILSHRFKSGSLKNAEAERKSAKAEHDKLLKKLKVCPFCGASKDCFHVEL